MTLKGSPVTGYVFESLRMRGKEDNTIPEQKQPYARLCGVVPCVALKDVRSVVICAYTVAVFLINDRQKFHSSTAL